MLAAAWRLGSSRWAVTSAAAGTATLVFASGGASADAAKAPLPAVERAKRDAAFRAVDANVTSKMVVGMGSGSTVVYAAERLGAKFASGALRDIVCVPTSFQARQLILEHGLPLSDLERTPVVDVAIDGADEVDVHLNCIKGGGGCQTQEKLVAANATRFVVIADSRKQSVALGRAWKAGVPVEVLPAARVTVARRVQELGGRATLRDGGKAKAGPAVTDQGNIILDCDFGVIDNPAELDARLRDIVGVVETGLFVAMAERAYFGQADGSVIEWVAGDADVNHRLMPSK